MYCSVQIAGYKTRECAFKKAKFFLLVQDTGVLTIMHFVQAMRSAWASTVAVCTASLSSAAFLSYFVIAPITGATLTLTTTSQAHAMPSCSSASSDSDGDGFGWENNQTCIVTSGGGDRPVCSSAAADPDGDGWGWENNRSCVVETQSTAASESDRPVCGSAISDSDNDGWGFENGRSCVVAQSGSSSTPPASSLPPGLAPPPVAPAVPGFSDGHPICLTDASDDGKNGFGYENNRTCRVVEGTTATRDQPLLNQRSCIPWLEIGYGNYRLQNNTWNSSAVFFNNWSQCIELTGGPGNYVAKWDYNWLAESSGQEFAVKSYPQVYYGRKSSYNLSGTKAETGLPAGSYSLPQFWVEYDYSETGVVERNVAFESFFHTSCDVENYNKQYEMMVWVGVPTIRTPGRQVTTARLSGQDWDVYINPSLSWAYVAFVAQDPSNQGTLNWNDFVEWSRDRGPSFGVPAMANNACMGAIELGTETFWGSGTFTLNRFRVNRS